MQRLSAGWQSECWAHTVWTYWLHVFSLRYIDTWKMHLCTNLYAIVCALSCRSIVCVQLCVCCIVTPWLARVGTNQLPIHLPRVLPPPHPFPLCPPRLLSLKCHPLLIPLMLHCPVHPALLIRFEDSDWLIDTLEALKALDRQLGFKALDQLAASTVARCRPSQPPQQAPHTSTHPASDPALQSTLQGAVAGAAELANVLFLLANLNHNPGHKPILVGPCCFQPASNPSCSQMRVSPCSARHT